MPLVSLENGMLQYSTVESGKSETVTAVPVNAQFRLHEETEEGYQFRIETGEIYPGIGQSRLSGTWKSGLITLHGGISSTDRPPLERSLAINAMAAQLAYEPNQRYDLDLSIKNLHGPPVPRNNARDLVFWGAENPLAGIQQFFYRYQPSGKINLRLRAQGNLSDLANSQIKGQIECLDLAVCDRKFVYPLDHLKGPISFTNNTIEGKGLRAQHAEVPVNIDFCLRGKGVESQYRLHLTSERMRLDDDLYHALSKSAQRAWDLVSPQGYAAIDYQLEKNAPSDKRRTLSVVLQNTSATYRGFPYPLTNLTGHIAVGKDQITLTDVVSHTDTMSITLNGQIRDYGTSHPQHDLRVQADRLPLDSTLGQALSPQQRAAYTALHIQGTTQADVYIRTDANDTKPASIYTNLSFQNASLLAPGIPLPFDSIYGRALLSAKSITLEDLQGQYSGNPVRISGKITLNRKSQAQAFDLSISSVDMAIGDFMTALPIRASHPLAQLNPQGKVAFSAQLSQKDPNDPVQYQAVLDCLSISMRPKSFPYPLRDITGRVNVNNEQCLIQEVKAIPDVPGKAGTSQGAVQINGQIAFHNGAMRTGSFQISGNRLPLDTTLVQALPEHLNRALVRLTPSGHLSLSPTDVKVSIGADGVHNIDYLANIHFDDARLNLLNTHMTLRGSLEATGHLDSRDGMRQGLVGVSLDSLTINHKEITDLHSLFTYQPKTRLWQSNDLTACVYSGMMLGQSSLQENGTGAIECKVQVGVNNVNLHDFLQDTADGNDVERRKTTGTANGTICFCASLGRNSSRMGRCTFHVTDMQVGKVSPLAKVLSSLGLTEAHDYAFDNLLVDSYIRDDELLIQTLDMSGSAIALHGSGSLHLPTGELDLTMIARGKRINLKEPTVFQSLTEGLVGAVVQLEFSGHYSNPVVTTRTLSLIENSFKLLGVPRN